MGPTLVLSATLTEPGANSADLENSVLELKDQIEHSLEGIVINETHKKNDGALGPEWLPVLTAILSAPVAIEMVKGVVTIVLDWMRRRKNVTLTIEGPNGKHVFSGTNLSGEEISQIAKKVV
jgi:phage/plasmid-associated DNA primase